MNSLPLAGCTFSWLHQTSLEEALRRVAGHGYRSIELTTAPPHLVLGDLDHFTRYGLIQQLKRLNLEVISVNPSYVDLNLISTNPEIQRVSEREIVRNIELAADLNAQFAVVIMGRRHALAPAPAPAVDALLDDVLERLIAKAQRLGVTLTLETNPYGYRGSSDDLVEVVDRVGSDTLKIAYDVANALAIEDPADGIRKVGSRLALSHVSDTWRDKWAHTSVGRGEVDFQAYADAHREIGFTGPTVYELVDGEEPDSRLDADIQKLAEYGWSIEAGAAMSLAG